MVCKKILYILSVFIKYYNLCLLINNKFFLNDFCCFMKVINFNLLRCGVINLVWF